MFVVVERARNVSGNMPITAIYGVFDDEDKAQEYCDTIRDGNGQDKSFRVELVTDVTSTKKK